MGFSCLYLPVSLIFRSFARKNEKNREEMDRKECYSGMAGKGIALQKMVALWCLLCGLGACASHPKGWKLVWEEDFKGRTLDTTVWSRIPRGTAQWQDTQSDTASGLVVLRDGMLVLRGIVNDHQETDKSPYLTGGVRTQDKHAFEMGRVEVKARLQGARGAWPAIWMMAFDTKNKPWPDGGEIDIMERLNYDTLAYQTVHSHYTYTLKQGSNPPQGSTGPIRPDEFNVYAATLYPDSVVLSINGKATLCYPRIDTDKRGQFPFYTPQYLLIDMQLGGDWVGKVHPEDLPVEMEIDWVRHYKPKGRKHER